jgi:hypothetical protein
MFGSGYEFLLAYGVRMLCDVWERAWDTHYIYYHEYHHQPTCTSFTPVGLVVAANGRLLVSAGSCWGDSGNRSRIQVSKSPHCVVVVWDWRKKRPIASFAGKIPVLGQRRLEVLLVHTLMHTHGHKAHAKRTQSIHKAHTKHTQSTQKHTHKPHKQNAHTNRTCSPHPVFLP